ncbi:MAG: phosphoribosylaminoimidazolesuccinocarboxamide synthase [Deltaproteobacteria bacterium]|nr:phosphoribosylaminoimidazolesuccinocarboxamide synthase [Deltaproteobacteria bacterium]
MLDRGVIAQNLGNTLSETKFEGLGERYGGKVRDVYARGDRIVMVTTDRVSAFDVVLGTIPFKGQVLNQIANYWFDVSKEIVANHIVDTPDPSVTVVKRCEALPVEVVVRGHITGSLWRAYAGGEREIYGLKLNDGLRRDQKFPEPIITPTTKAGAGEHDAPITPAEVVSRGLVDRRLWDEVCKKALALFETGSKLARERGLVLVDTKYEFGLQGGRLVLIDEVHTPDSSRYWMAAGYEERFAAGKDQEMLDKENLRQWLLDRGFSGTGTPPALTDEVRVMLAEKYIELFERMTGRTFEAHFEPISDRIETNLKKAGYLS